MIAAIVTVNRQTAVSITWTEGGGLDVRGRFGPGAIQNADEGDDDEEEC